MSCLLLTLGLLLAPLQTAPDETVVTIGEVSIDADEYGAWLVERVGRTHLDTFLIERMLVMEGRARGLAPTPEELAEAYDAEVVEQIQNYYRGDREAWLTFLDGLNETPESFRHRRLPELEAEMCLMALASQMRTITEEQVRERFKLIYGDLEEAVAVDVLFFDFYEGLTGRRQRPPIEQLEARARNRADTALERLESGTPFEALAAISDPFESDFADGMHIPTWRKNLLGPEVEAALSRLDEPGEVSGAVRVWNGFYIVRLAERRPVTFEGERPLVEQFLRDEPITADEMNDVRGKLYEIYRPEMRLP